MPVRLLLAVSLLALVVGSLQPTDILADDRDLFRSITSSGSPYFFFLMDTSSSFNFSMLNEPWIDPDDPVAYENCTGSRPGFDCYFGREEFRDHDGDSSTPTVPNTFLLPGGADHPASRGYQAKKAIYSVLKALPDGGRCRIRPLPESRHTRAAEEDVDVSRDYGSDHLALVRRRQRSAPASQRHAHPARRRARHQLLRLRRGTSRTAASRPSSSAPLAALPDLISFAGLTFFGGFGTYPTDDFHRALRFHMHEKLGADGSSKTYHFTEWNGKTYRMDFEPLSVGQNLGDTNLTLDVTVDECTSTTTTTTNSDGTDIDQHDLPPDRQSDDGADRARALPHR